MSKVEHYTYEEEGITYHVSAFHIPITPHTKELIQAIRGALGVSSDVPRVH